jgi:hypothetical protein
MKSRYLLILVGLIALPAMASAGGPPPARLRPGLWQFHYHSTTEMNGHALPGTRQSVRQCVKNTDPAKIPLLPHLPPNIKCTAPALTVTAAGYQVRLSCTAAESNGMVSRLEEEFQIMPSKDGDRMTLAGTVHQAIVGGPVAIPPVRVQIVARGQRIGVCPVPAH